MKAAQAYEAAVETARTPDGRAIRAEALARSLFSAGKRTEAVDILTTEIRDSTDPEALSTLYKGLASPITIWVNLS